MSFIRVQDPRGAEVREIKSDSIGKYLGDRVQDFSQGSILETEGELEARLSRSDTHHSRIFQIKNRQSLVLGVDSSVVEFHTSGTLRIESGLTSGQDVDVLVSQNDENRIHRGSGMLSVNLITLRDNSPVSLNLTVLEISGSEYRLGSIVGLAGASVMVMNSGNSFTVILDL